jgi:hypothetical protein
VEPMLSFVTKVNEDVALGPFFRFSLIKSPI